MHRNERWEYFLVHQLKRSKQIVSRDNQPFKTIRKRTFEMARTAVDDKSELQPAVVSFASIDQLREILTKQRIKLLRALIASDGAVEGISMFADTFDYTTTDQFTMIGRYSIATVPSSLLRRAGPTASTCLTSESTSLSNPSVIPRMKNPRQYNVLILTAEYF